MILNGYIIHSLESDDISSTKEQRWPAVVGNHAKPWALGVRVLAIVIDVSLPLLIAKVY